MQIAENLIQGLCDETLPELRPSYLNENERRKTLLINDCKIRLNIRNQTCAGSAALCLPNMDSELIILTLESGSNGELYQIQQYLDMILQMNGTIKNCIILLCSSLYKMYNDDRECMIVNNKIELFCKHWNVRCININKNLFSPYSFFIYCVKYVWFCDVHRQC